MKALLFITAIVVGIGADAAAATRRPAAQRPQRVDILFSDFAFTPPALHLRQGQPYRLHFVNQGSGGHNYAAPEFFAAARIDPADAASVAGGRVELGRGESRDVRLVPTAGAYRVVCTHPLHATFGMVGTITVD
jgi:uncharacterized cupredoxin-like copper-binding protein